MKEKVIAQLNGYITTEILKQPDKILAADELLISGGFIDSFSLVDLTLFVEQTWHVRIEDTELNADTFDTLNELADLILARRNQE